MTLEEAQQIADIIKNADGGCSHCIEILRKMCEDNFPQYSWEYRDATSEENHEWDYGPHLKVTKKND